MSQYVDLLAAIAEYRDIAILERCGNVKKVWQGQEYYTDGKIHLAYVEDDAKKSMILENEEAVKYFIDLLKDNPDQVPTECKKHFLSFLEIHEVLYKTPWKGNPPQYEWNPILKVFEMKLSTSDGQHRHGTKNG